MTESYLVLRVFNDYPTEVFLTTEDGTIINGVKSISWEADVDNGEPPTCTIKVIGVGVYALPGFLQKVEKEPTPEEARARAIELLSIITSGEEKDDEMDQ